MSIKKDLLNWLRYLTIKVKYCLMHLLELMKKIKRAFFKRIPVLIAFFIGLTLFLLSFYLSKYSELLIGLSTTACSIAFIIPIIEWAINYKNGKLHPEIPDYINLKINSILMKLLHRLCRFISPHITDLITLSDIKNLDAHTQLSLEDMLREKFFIGFDLFIEWNKYTNQLEELLSNNMISANLNAEQINFLLVVIKAIKTWGNIIDRNFDKLFAPLNKNISNMKITVDEEGLYTLIFNDNQINWAYNKSSCESKLTQLYKINPEFVEPVSKNLVKIISNIDDLITSFGNRIILDPSVVQNKKSQKPFKEIFTSLQN
ncbi:hypothetical protein [Legionella oakridgensis]|uniref:hypothetical protein n=1 Tax=Legionella oakridgensis TaxID=29423 RepID=UPI0003DE1D15|nr:hypothetical protein [Legionella oakridgensis]ETO93481.1 hypothetical protein LOR_90c25100 [Legionella oakridgensis RV-2-2007]